MDSNVSVVQKTSALWRAPGRFSAVVTYSADALPPAEVRRRVAALMQLFDRPREQLRAGVVFALSPAMLVGMPGFEDVSAQAFPGEGEGEAYVRTAGDVFVQFGAESQVNLLRATRIVAEILRAPASDGAAMRCELSVSGGRIFNGEEAFGFREGAPTAAHREATLSQVAAPGGWLLFQIYSQRVREFFAERARPEERARVVGRAPHALPVDEGDSDSDFSSARAARANADREMQNKPPNDAHYQRMRPGGASLPLLRRGFPCTTPEGDEGLAFVAVGSSPAPFETALRRMVGNAKEPRDALLQYITPLHGNVYFFPADPAWLAADAPTLKTPLSAKQIDRRVPLADYMAVQSFIIYLMELRGQGLFDDPNQPSRVSDEARGPLDALYAALAKSSPGDPEAVIAQLRRLEQQTIADAIKLNAETDEYISFG